MEEQEMEAEALEAIFDTAFEITSGEQPFHWSLTLYPEDTEDEAERDELNHVACKLNVEVPCDYPDVLPVMDVEVVKVRLLQSGVSSYCILLFDGCFFIGWRVMLD
jgi:hypothetical protein